MNVYQLDDEGFYVETVAADPDHLVPGQFLIPGGCITTPPPTFQGGKRARWNGSAWELVRVTSAPAPVTLTEAELLELARESWTMTDIQFAIAASHPSFAFMTAQEAQDWAGAGIIPAIGLAALNSISDPQEKLEATIRFRGARFFNRRDPFIGLLQSFLGLTDEQADAFFQLGMSK